MNQCEINRRENFVVSRGKKGYGYKGSAPFYRLITDARYGNSLYSDWGVTYRSAADLSAALQPRDFTWSADLQDAYHLSVFAGCGGALRPCKLPVVQDDGTLSWIDGYIVGCSPETLPWRLR